jgi:hypothetical protein
MDDRHRRPVANFLGKTFWLLGCSLKQAEPRDHNDRIRFPTAFYGFGNLSWLADCGPGVEQAFWVEKSVSIGGLRGEILPLNCRP